VPATATDPKMTTMDQTELHSTAMDVLGLAFRVTVMVSIV